MAAKSSGLDSDKQIKISEFLQDMQELGIGHPAPSPLHPAPSITLDENLPGTSSDSKSGSIATSSSAPGEGVAGCVVLEEKSLSDVEKRLVSEWVPLGLNFGIPLFDEGANKVVCDKVMYIVYTKLPELSNTLAMPYIWPDVYLHLYTTTL